MTLGGYVARRLLHLVPIVLGVTILVFFLIHLEPGDPARTILGNQATDQRVALLRHQWGLDRPLPVQYEEFMKRIVHGDLGRSLFYDVPAGRLVLDRLPVTMWLIGFGTLLSILISVPLAALAISPILIRSLRASLLEVFESEYVTTARAKGLPERRVLVKHALRNAVVSTVNVLGVNIAYFVGGTVIIEQVFGLPGVGQLMINATFTRDFPVVQAVTLVFAVLVVLVYLTSDVVHALLDPRVRFD